MSATENEAILNAHLTEAAAALDTLSRQATETARELRDEAQRWALGSVSRDRWNGVADKLEAAIPERADREAPDA